MQQIYSKSVVMLMIPLVLCEVFSAIILIIQNYLRRGLGKSTPSGKSYKVVIIVNVFPALISDTAFGTLSKFFCYVATYCYSDFLTVIVEFCFCIDQRHDTLNTNILFNILLPKVNALLDYASQAKDSFRIGNFNESYKKPPPLIWRYLLKCLSRVSLSKQSGKKNVFISFLL